MKIATFNVNGIRSRLPNLLEWLQRETPDVACLQELKAADDAFPVTTIGAAGYQAVSHGQKDWNGVAILARGTTPVETRGGLPEGNDDSHGRYIEVKVKGMLIGQQDWIAAMTTIKLPGVSRGFVPTIQIASTQGRSHVL